MRHGVPNAPTVPRETLASPPIAPLRTPERHSSPAIPPCQRQVPTGIMPPTDGPWLETAADLMSGAFPNSCTKRINPDCRRGSDGRRLTLATAALGPLLIAPPVASNHPFIAQRRALYRYVSRETHPITETCSPCPPVFYAFGRSRAPSPLRPIDGRFRRGKAHYELPFSGATCCGSG